MIARTHLALILADYTFVMTYMLARTVEIIRRQQ